MNPIQSFLTFMAFASLPPVSAAPPRGPVPGFRIRPARIVPGLGREAGSMS